MSCCTSKLIIRSTVGLDFGMGSGWRKAICQFFPPEINFLLSQFKVVLRCSLESSFQGWNISLATCTTLESQSLFVWSHGLCCTNVLQNEVVEDQIYLVIHHARMLRIMLKLGTLRLRKLSEILYLIFQNRKKPKTQALTPGCNYIINIICFVNQKPG